jgi:hypothetical protein
VRSVLRRISAVIGIVALVTFSFTTVAWASGRHDGLAGVRRATARFHDLQVAEEAGYGLFPDAAGVSCIDMPGKGAMGVHYVNGDLVGDATLDKFRPEALVYAPDDEGRLRLAALEYIVFQNAWDFGHRSPPELFGHEFMLTTSPNRYGLEPFYSLHVWVWRANPAGRFAMWNPDVSCDPSSDENIDDLPAGRHRSHA